MDSQLEWENKNIRTSYLDPTLERRRKW